MEDDRDRRKAGYAGLDGACRAGALSVNRLSHLDERTGEPVRRYERPYAGATIHVDVTRFGNIP